VEKFSSIAATGGPNISLADLQEEDEEEEEAHNPSSEAFFRCPPCPRRLFACPTTSLL